MTIYFAKDGNYGDAFAMFTCDTAEWTDADWIDIEEASDSERVNVAIAIASKYA